MYPRRAVWAIAYLQGPHSRGRSARDRVLALAEPGRSSVSTDPLLCGGPATQLFTQDFDTSLRVVFGEENYKARFTTRALRLKNGNTLISDQYNHRVIEASPDKQIVRSFGKIATLGYNTHSVAHGGLNSPYDAKRIGDYTGITPPFDNDNDADNAQP